MTNLINYSYANGDTRWKGFIMYKTYMDRNGQPFPDRCARYVGFHNNILIAEKHHFRDVEREFNSGTRDNTCRLEDYIGITTK